MTDASHRGDANESGADREEQLLVELLREVGPVLATPSAAHVRQMHRLIASRTVTPTRARRRWTISIGLTAAASILLLLFGLDSFRRQDSWAQVAKNVRERPWLHSVMKYPDGQTDEFWWSFTGHVAARKAPYFVRFEDFRAGVREEFTVKTKELVRLPIQDTELLKSMAGTFQAIFRGDDKLGDTFADFRIESQKRREVVRDGHKWIDYELKVINGTQPAALTIVVDPAKNLSISMELKSERETATFELTFPDEGPSDIYALGVPRDTKVDNRLPPAELATVLRAIKQGREHSHNYFSVVLQGGHPSDLVWRKGSRWRVALCMAKKHPIRKTPQPDEKLADWLSQFVEYPVQFCDGHAVYKMDNSAPEKEPSWKLVTTLRSDSVEASSSAAGSYGNPSSAMAELSAYASLVPSAQFDLTLDPKPSEGPEGTLLITSSARGDLGANAYHLSRYWVDPAFGYAVVRYEHSKLNGAKAVDKPTGHDRVVYELADFVKSPAGLWYPTTIRRKNAVHEKDKDGQEILSDDVRTFYYDFKADLPDELFKK